MKVLFKLIIAFAFIPFQPALAQNCNKYIAIDIRLGDIVKGERVITFIRLLSPQHPQAMGHEYPTATSLHKKEVETMIYLGKLLNWNLYATLNRHPTNPVEAWAFEGEFLPSPSKTVKEAKVLYEAQKAPIPGLKSLAFVDRCPVGLIIDTRDLSLEERNMKRSVSSGLDIPRTTFDKIIRDLLKEQSQSSGVIIWK